MRRAAWIGVEILRRLHLLRWALWLMPSALPGRRASRVAHGDIVQGGAFPMNYYNEFSDDAATWLENLIRAGLIPNGYVDRRNIREVTAADLAGFTQCHFFAGIGGWSEALRLAGWGSDQPVWTGSCPCQPFSAAGKRKGVEDERHVWPEFARLIGECRPAIVFGEQVASRDGRKWLSGVRVDLEAVGYAVGAADLCAPGVGAPHIRQRLYFGAIRMGDADVRGRIGRQGYAEHERQTCGRPQSEREPQRASEPDGGMGDASGAGLAGPAGFAGHNDAELAPAERTSPWAGAAWLKCADGKSRRIKPGVPLLVDGLPRDVACALSGFGNAIVPQVGAQFVRAFSEAAEIAL